VSAHSSKTTGPIGKFNSSGISATRRGSHNLEKGEEVAKPGGCTSTVYYCKVCFKDVIYIKLYLGPEKCLCPHNSRTTGSDCGYLNSFGTSAKRRGYHNFYFFFIFGFWVGCGLEGWKRGRGFQPVRSRVGALVLFIISGLTFTIGGSLLSI
jgi:hypothetical protein